MTKNLREAFGLSWRSAPRLCVAIMVVPLLQSILIGGQLLLLQQLTQRVIEGGSRAETVQDVVPLVGLMVVGLVGLLVLDNFQTLVRELLTERVRQVSARRMHRAIGQLSLIDFDYPQTHDRVVRASATDFRPAQVVRSLTSILASAIRIVLLTVAVVLIEPLLVPALLVLAVPVLLLSRLLAGDRYAFVTRTTGLDRRRLYYSQLLTTRRAAAESRAYGLADRFGRRYDELSTQRLTELRGMLGRQWRRMLAGQAAFAVLVGGSLAVLAWFYASGRSEVGALIAAAVGLAQVANMIGGLGWPASELAEAGLFLADQREFLDQIEHRQAPAPAAAVEIPPLRTLTVQDVSFTYPSGGRPALDKVSMNVDRGQIVALVGPNGSGKTTLAKLIGALYEAGEGSVRWNGQDCSELDRAALRARIATVFQDFQTYAESIRDNVAFGAVDRPVDDERVRWALAAAGFAAGELDLDRELGPEYEGGTDLSGGQQQRLAVARALYRDADLLILDEPTSALDARAEHTLLAELRAMRRTTILVSHRLANVAEADRILVFGAGRVIEEGSHDDLMALGGVYHELYQLQANLYSHGEGEVSLSYGPAQERERGTR
jgi:ATP-binding cassette subfamily B protein